MVDYLILIEMKREQVKLLESLDVDPDDFRLEKDRVDKVIELYQSDSARVDSTLKAHKEYVPTKSEVRNEKLFKMNKKDQVNLLLEYGLSNRKIKTLKYEKDRVEMIIKLESKKSK